MQLSDPAALSRADSVASLSGSGSVLHSRQPSMDQSADTVQPRHSTARLGPSQLARHSLAASQALNPSPAAAAPPAPASESAAVPAHGPSVAVPPRPASEAPLRQPEAAESKAGDAEVPGKAEGAGPLPAASEGALSGLDSVVSAAGSPQQLSRQAVQPEVTSSTETSGKPPRPPDPLVQAAEQASSPEKAACSATAAGRPVLPGAAGPQSHAPHSCHALPAILPLPCSPLLLQASSCSRRQAFVLASSVPADTRVHASEPQHCCTDTRPEAPQPPAGSSEEPKLAASPTAGARDAPDGKAPEEASPAAARDPRAAGASVRARAKAFEQQQQQQPQQPMIRLPTWVAPQKAFSTTDAVLQWLNEERRARPSQLSSSSLAGELHKCWLGLQ